MCKFGVNTVEEKITFYPDYTLEVYKGCLDKIKQYGFEYIEHSHVQHFSLKDINKINEYSKKLGLKSHSAHSEGSIHKYGEKKYFEVQEEYMKNAKALGCEIIVFHLPTGTMSLEENLKPVKKFAELAGEYGLKAGLENGPVDIILEIIKTLDMPELGFTLDTGHAFMDDYDLRKCIQDAGEKLIHTHIADNFGISDDHLPPGMGLIQWQDVMKELKAVNYSGVQMVELTDCTIKAKRSIKSLIDFPLESEMDIAFKSLCYLNNRKI